MMEAFEVHWANRFASTSIFMTLHGETRETAALLIIVLFFYLDLQHVSQEYYIFVLRMFVSVAYLFFIL